MIIWSKGTTFFCTTAHQEENVFCTIKPHWNRARIWFKFNKRKGQTIKFTVNKTENMIEIDPNTQYGTIEFWIKTNNFEHPKDAIIHCLKNLKIEKSICWEAPEEFISKELFIALNS